MVRVIKYCNGCGDQMVEEELEYNTAYCFKCHPDFDEEFIDGPPEEDRPIDQGVLSDTGVGLLESTIRTLFGNRREDTSWKVIGFDN
jgi:hypothetical protein